jgi:vacuolar-type H+-ATPase subunit C/Vma6
MPVPKDLDFLAARLHGRRSVLAEGARLDELCRIRTHAELSRLLYPELGLRSARELQRRMIGDLARELDELTARLKGAGAALLSWQCARLQVENFKVLARGFATGTPLAHLRPHLIAVPGDRPPLDAAALAGAVSFAAFVAAMPPGPLRAGLEEVRDLYQAQPRPFVLEAGLDLGYLRELVRRAGRLADDARAEVQCLASQEADIFHLMLAARGVFHYGLKPETLAGLHVAGSALSRKEFAAMLSAGDLASVAAAAVGRVVDSSPAAAEAAELEALAWNRFHRLANGAFRRGHMGVGAAIGYAALRRIELANLIMLSEGLRMGLDARVLRSRLIPLSGGAADV